MHPNPAFRRMTQARNLAYARDRGFGVLTVNGEAGPLAAHIPFLLDEDGRVADLHLVRSNPIHQSLTQPEPALIAVSGPDGYISPDWYEVADQVPTWNYVAVHLRGMLEPLPQDHMADLLDRQSAHFEALLLPKTPWSLDKMTPAVRDRMMRQIVPYRLQISQIDGTWKLNQNKDSAARKNAAQMVKAYPTGSEAALLAALMLGATDE